MPAEEGLRRDQGVPVTAYPSPEARGLCGPAPALGVGDPEPARTALLSEDAMLFLERVNAVTRLLVDPARDGHDEELQHVGNRRQTGRASQRLSAVTTVATRRASSVESARRTASIGFLDSTGVLMRRASFIAFTVGGMLILGPASDVWAQSGAGGTPRAGWYVGGGIGANWASDIDQEGWNRDPLCYPTDACFDADPVPEISGYRWRYDIDAAAGAVFEISTGLMLDRTRLELSLAQRKNSLDQMFRSITDYDGMAMEERRGSSVVSSTESSIDTLTVRTLVLNAYYDFPGTYRGISPYLGAGLGPAFVEVSGVHFSSEYEDTSGNDQAHNPPLSFYNSRQDANLSNTVLAGHLHAGADYSLNDKTVLGLKLTYSMMGDIEASSGYSRHPLHERDSDFPNHNTFTGARYWTLTMTVKRLFGN